MGTFTNIIGYKTTQKRCLLLMNIRYGFIYLWKRLQHYYSNINHYVNREFAGFPNKLFLDRLPGKTTENATYPVVVAFYRILKYLKSGYNKLLR